MNNSLIASAAGQTLSARPLFKGAFSALLAGFISLSLPVAFSRAQTSSYEAEGEVVLTRGPVHEAFAAVVSYNPAPGIVVRTRPPELIEELPPEERPEGDDVAWIPGYWGWDDERNDYLWISGTWRILPPGREWMAGYWRENDDGYRWISGYWADATERETTYLPPPPATLEVGANIGAPSDDYGWTPGYWDWQQDRYAWRAGYWAEGRADWVWSPSYYVWTPRGFIFVEGFWDYPVARRGILFAPVYYQSRGYARRGYSYSPRIAINLSLFLDNLFLRPSYHHYYFGDYYGSRYEQDGFYASISFHSSRQGFDPFYSHNRWEHRSDRDWENHYRASYQDRRDHEAARPPRTWSAQLTLNLNPAPGGQVRVQLAAPLAQLARSPDNLVRFQPVAQGDRQQLARRGREVQESRDQRRTVEAKAAVTTGRSAAVAVEPVRVAAPRSPIVANPAAQRGRNPAPPQAQQAPKPNAQVSQPRAENTGRPQNADRRNAPPEARQPEPQRKAPAEQRTNESSRQAAPEAQRQAPQDVEKRARDTEAKTQAEAKSQQKANEAAAANKQQAGERRDAAEAKARDESQRKTQESQQKAQQESDRRNHDAADRARQQDEERTKESATKARDESQRQQQETRSRQDADKRNRDEQQKSQAMEKSRQQDEERSNNSARKARDESEQKAKEPAAKAQQNEERANPPAAKVREESPRPVPEARGKQQDDPKRAREESAKAKPASKDKTADEEDDEVKKEKQRGR